MTIHFYLNDEQETPITSFHELQFNPFKVGDIICVSVDDLVPAALNNFQKEHRITVVKKNEELRSLFNRKKIIIVKEGQYIRFDTLSEPKHVIEYHAIS